MTGPKRGDTAATWRPGTRARLEQSGEPGQTEAPAQSEAPAPPGTELVMGQVIAGTRYRLLSTIGEGGMGTVYAAEHVDLEKKVRIPLDCDLAEIGWYPGPRVACANPAHTEIAVMDLRDRQVKTHAYDGESSKACFPSDRFFGWAEHSRRTTTLVDVDTGVTHMVPGPIAGLLEDGPRTIALLTMHGIGWNRGSVSQLWDISVGRGLRQPWPFSRTIVSPCWMIRVRPPSSYNVNSPLAPAVTCTVSGPAGFWTSLATSEVRSTSMPPARMNTGMVSRPALTVAQVLPW
jgi:hypothetical protein